MKDVSKERQLSGLEKEIVSALIETKAVNFEALGAALAKYGPSASMMYDGEDWFCATMRWFVRFYRIPGPLGPSERIQDLAQIREMVAPEVRR